MPARKVFFFEKKKMLANFQRIIKEDPPMGTMTFFYDFLIRFAGQETDERNVILILIQAMPLVGLYLANISKHVDAMVDDAQAVAKARQMLENIAVLAATRR